MVMKQKKSAVQTKAKTTTAGSTVKVALLGFGTVGSSVARVLATSKFPGVQLTHIFNRNVERKRTCAAAKWVPASSVWTENIDEIFKSDAHALVGSMSLFNPVQG